MLKSLTLNNFRSHAHTVIDLTTGVNILVGRGQAGKTNVKRALEWLANNRPLGTKMHSWWCKEGDITSVIAATMEGHTVTISKPMGGSVEYLIVHPDGSRDEFRKVGSKVPDKVTQVLNLGDLSLQGQLDQPYLVTAGTGEISRAVNQVVDLEVADQWLTTFNSRRQQNTVAINNLKKQHQAAVNGLKAYIPLPSVKKALVAADRVQTALNKAQVKAQGVWQWLGMAGQAQEAMARLEPGMAAEAKIKQAESMLARIKESQREAAMCEALFAAAQAWEQAVAEFTQVGDQYMALLKELGVCPTCYTPVSQDTLDHIAGQLTAETL